MSDKTLTRMDLSEAVFRAVGLSRNESAQLVERVLDLMSDALVEGEQVKISSFGTFSVRDKSARVGRNPKTGEEVPIQPRRVLTFRHAKRQATSRPPPEGRPRRRHIAQKHSAAIGA
jgi:integration host factor subunit alpha